MVVFVSLVHVSVSDLFLNYLLSNNISCKKKVLAIQYIGTDYYTSMDYLKFGFIKSPSNTKLSMCLLCNRVVSNEAMKSLTINLYFLFDFSTIHFLVFKNKIIVLFREALKNTLLLKGLAA